MTTIPTPDLNGIFGALVPITPTFKDDPQELLQADEGLKSDKIIQYIYTINAAIICGACCVAGIVFNIINVIVINKMEFRDPINVALMSLTISDLFSLTSLLLLTICYNPLFLHSDIPKLTIGKTHKILAGIHVIFSRLTAFITMYITLERCLCIVFPLKIKMMLTPKRVLGIMVGIYVVIVGTLVLNLFSLTELLQSNVLELNKTMLGVIPVENRTALQTVQNSLNIIFNTTSYGGIIFCSSILIWKLRQRRKFVTRVNSGEGLLRTIQQNNQVIKMIICVAIVFIVSFLPSVIFYVAMLTLDGFNVGEKHQILFVMITTLGMTFEAINSTVNIFIYYRMSSRYAAAFHNLFRLTAGGP